MQKHHELTLKRLQTFRKVLESRFYKQRQAVELFHYAAPGRIPIQDALQADYQPIAQGYGCNLSGPLIGLKSNQFSLLTGPGRKYTFFGIYPAKPAFGWMGRHSKDKRFK